MQYSKETGLLLEEIFNEFHIRQFKFIHQQGFVAKDKYSKVLHTKFRNIA